VKTVVALALLFSLNILLFQNCGGGGTVLENPLKPTPGPVIIPPDLEDNNLIYSAYGSAGASSGQGAMKAFKIDDSLSIYICIMKVVFRRYGTGEKQFFDVGTGEVELESTGTPLGKYDLLPGNYLSVKLKLFDEICPDNATIRVINTNGEFVTSTWFHLIYDDLNAVLRDPEVDKIELDINPLVDALRNVDSSEGIAEAIVTNGLGEVSND